MKTFMSSQNILNNIIERKYISTNKLCILIVLYLLVSYLFYLVYLYTLNLVLNYIISIDTLLTGLHADTTMIIQKKH